VGVRDADSRQYQRFLYDPAMLFLLSLVVRALARLLAGRRSDDGSRELEILVLRHQLRVLRRKAGRPALRPVVPDPEGWNVVAPGSERASGHFETQGQAIDRARAILHNSGGGEVVIHGTDGKIRDSDTVPPGHDPSPPRDER